MTFKDGEKTGEKCPDCGGDLIYEMSFTDEFSHTGGHYTSDWPIVACEKCDYYKDYEPEEPEYERE